MAVYYILVGSLGAGKSTIRKQFDFCKIVCPDDYRDECRVDVKTAYDMARKEIPKLLQAGNDVLLDATNAYPEKRIGMINIGKPFASEVICIWMDTPKELCLARHEERLARMIANKEDIHRYENQAKPIADIIVDYCDALRDHPPNLLEGFNQIIRIKPSEIQEL